MTEIQVEISRIAALTVDEVQCSLPDILNRALDRIFVKEKFSAEGKLTGIPTGLTELDQITSGWQPGNLVVLAGRPSHGKTALSLFFLRQACEANRRVLFYTLEQTNDEVAERLILGGDGNHEEAANRISHWNLLLKDNGFADLNHIKTNARIEKPELIVIDYLHLMKLPKAEYYRLELGEATKQLKMLAKELSCPIILLSQLNRDVTNRSNPKHSLSDLRDSGNIEQDADLVIFVYQPAKLGFKEIDGYSTTGITIVQVEKQRNGRTGTMMIRHNESVNSYSDF